MEEQVDIISSAPEIHATIIDSFYTDIVGVYSQKDVHESFLKSRLQNGVIYHAMAVLDNTVLLVTKQTTDLCKGEGHSDEYLCIVELSCETTTVESDGHARGRVDNVLRSWCACSAGHSRSMHKGMALWSQLHHCWETGRTTDKSCTAQLCICAPTCQRTDVEDGTVPRRACQEDYEDPYDEDAGYGRNESKFGTLLAETGLSQEDIDFMECNMGPATFAPLYDLMRQRNSET